MAKKATLKKLKPSDALASLIAYHEAVVLLVQTAKTVVPHCDVRVRDMLDSSIKGVESFFEEGRE